VGAQQQDARVRDLLPDEDPRPAHTRAPS
jgi:hypothetical protein